MLGLVYKSDLEELNSSLISEINDLREEIEPKLELLKEEIHKKATDSEEVAKQAAESAKIHEGNASSATSRIGEHAKAIEEIKNFIDNLKQKITEEQEYITEKNDSLDEKIGKTEDAYNEIIAIRKSVTETVNQIKSDSDEIAEYLEKSRSLPEQVTTTQELIEKSNKNLESINELLNHAISKKSEIDELHRKIHGTDIEKEDGEIEHTDGLKDQLENSYKRIAEGVKNLEANLQATTNEIIISHKKRQETQQEEFKNLIKSSTDTLKLTEDQLKALMPSAMAAGLSTAYEEKKNEEARSLAKFEQNFKYAIYGLIAVSLIPFFIDVSLLLKNHELISVIKETPSLIISILPLYFPVLWLAYSSNKKTNLSKRLIEEYTHKAVLGKTFSGLSNQIDSLPHEGKIKEELRTKLLFSVLQVSAENPGKLITDYQKSDHPLMDALEKSAKLSEAVDALSKIPGFNTLAKTLSEKGEELLSTQTKKVDEGLKFNFSLDQKDKTDSNESDVELVKE